YSQVDWPADNEPRTELPAYIGLVGFAVLLLPIFLATAFFKVGNLANDGFKLGRSLSTCAVDPRGAGIGGARSLWRHAGPIAPMLHMASALCLLLPRLLMEAKLVQTGFLPKDMIWRTDLDFLLGQRDRLVLSFMIPPPPVLASAANSTFLPPQDVLPPPGPPHSLPLSIKHPVREIAINDETQWGPVSAEIVNFAIALVVYTIRYPAVFWNTNKWFGILFSIQLLVNSVQILLVYAGVCVIYKVHVIGPTEALPLLQHRSTLSLGIPQHFLLNAHITLGLFLLSTLLVTLSSMVLYLYGYGRLNAFMNRQRSRNVITLSDNVGHGWGYFSHCAALSVLIAMAVCEAPLLYDCTIVYRGSLSCAVLACVVGAVVHLFLWVLLWLALTLKQHWIFKLRVTVGRAAVRSARSIRLVTEVDLLSSTDAAAPLLIVGNGRTYTVSETSPKKAIMTVIQKSIADKRGKTGDQRSNSRDWLEKDDEQIYWLRPKPRSPKNSPDSSTSTRIDWMKKPTQTKHKVTFDPSSKKLERDDEDDGDYARLRELPLLTAGVDHSDDTASEDNKATPRCLRRADSGMPQEELTPRSDSVSTEASGGSPPDNSETSSGVHSSSSRESAQRRSTSVDDLATNADNKIQPQWRSFSLQRGVQPPQQQDIVHFGQIRMMNSNPPEPIYAPYRPHQHFPNGLKSPPVINEVAEEDTVVIRRRQGQVEGGVAMAAVAVGGQQQVFGRSTNMRMTSFTDRPQQSATLPHYPTTQNIGAAYPHCSTMPLPVTTVVPPPSVVATNATATNSCHSFPRQHTTIPTHHNGVRLFNPANPYTKRMPFPGHKAAAAVMNGAVTEHHSFPQIMNLVKHKTERDSANFSLASSGIQNQCMPHT
ncbi:hypothetical protein LSTR_LSTR003655, partial [Laodelphax striatellus]